MRRLAPLLVAALVLVACSGDDEPEIGTAAVTSGEVVQTIAAAATVVPQAQVAVTAPLSGEVIELLVADGDEVKRGQPLLRLASSTLEQQLAQAEAAVAAADALGGTAGAGAIDLAPLLGGFRTQLDAVIPSLLSTLEGQLAAAEAAAEQAAALAERAPIQLPDERGGPDLDSSTALTAAQDRVDEARARLDEARAGYQQARASLVEAEQQAASSTRQAESAQAAAVAAQRDQAEAALAAIEDRTDELVVEAPTAGVVELARGGSGGGGLPDLEALAGGGDLADAEALLGETGGTGATDATAPVAEGSAVSAGQTLLTVYDLSRFSVEVDVDEIDVVEVEVDQPVTVLVDAFADRELSGVVDRVAIAPEAQPQGGAIYPVSVRLGEVPSDLRLRVGLTASAEVEVRRVEADVVVPTAALLRRGDAEVVYAVRDGVAREVPVEVLAIGDDTAAVASRSGGGQGSLEPGEVVVTTGVELVGDGDELAG